MSGGAGLSPRPIDRPRLRDTSASPADNFYRWSHTHREKVIRIWISFRFLDPR